MLWPGDIIPPDGEGNTVNVFETAPPGILVTEGNPAIGRYHLAYLDRGAEQKLAASFGFTVRLGPEIGNGDLYYSMQHSGSIMLAFT